MSVNDAAKKELTKRQSELGFVIAQSFDDLFGTDILIFGQEGTCKQLVYPSFLPYQRPNKELTHINCYFREITTYENICENIWKRLQTKKVLEDRKPFPEIIWKENIVDKNVYVRNPR